MALIKCKDCNNEISDKATTCIHCGCPVEKIMFCGECGKEVSINDRICSECGNPLDSNENVSEVVKNNVSNQKSDNSTNNLCLSGMIVGIISFFIDFWGLVSATGLTLSIIGYNQVKGTNGSNLNRARIGIVCSSIELALKVIQIISLIATL